MSNTNIDVFEFCRRAQQLEGSAAVADFSRLTAELADKRGNLRWSVKGGQHASGKPQLLVQVDGEVHLMCQRCLTAYALPVASESVLVATRDDAEADQTEILLNDDSIDVIVVTEPLDLLAVVEDEVLLALPVSPRHAVCPDGAALAAVNDKAESPFAVLKKLK